MEEMLICIQYMSAVLKSEQCTKDDYHSKLGNKYAQFWLSFVQVRLHQQQNIFVQNALLISVYLNGLQAHNIYFAFGPPDLLNWCNFCQLMSVTVVVAFSLIALYNGLAFCQHNKKEQCSSVDIKGAMPISLLFTKSNQRS